VAPVSPDIDEFAGEFRSVVEFQSGDVDFSAVGLCQPSQPISDQHQPVDCRQRYEQLTSRRSSKLGRRHENANRKRVADEADRDDDSHGAEVHVETDVFNPH